MKLAVSATSLAMLLCLAGQSAAQTAYDPAIAYTQLQGKTQSVYVANADDSHAVRIASSNKSINGVDFAPGGGRVAVTGADGLRVVSYSASNSGVTVTGTATLVNGAVGLADFSADGSRILYSLNRDFFVVPASGGTPLLLYSANAVLGPVHWLRPAEMGNAFAYLGTVAHGPNIPVDYVINVVLLDDNDQLTSVSTVVNTATQAFKAIDDFDVARTRNALLLTANYPTTVRFVDYDIATAQLVDRGGNGFRGRYEANDMGIVSRADVKGGSFIDRLDVGSGLITHLTAKGSYGALDARP